MSESIGYTFTSRSRTSRPGSKSTFTQAELKTIFNRVERDRGDAEPDKLTPRKVVAIGLRWEFWAYGLMLLCCSAPIYAFAYFIQTILTTLGYTAA